MVRYVGLDVHRSIVQVCIQNERGETIATHRFDGLCREVLLRFAKQHLTCDDRVALEATTNTWEITRLLTPFVHDITVSNPLTTHAIAKAKMKSDKVDASVLAHLLRCNYLPEVWQPDPQTILLRQLLARRCGLVSQQTAVKNRIHSVLAQKLIPLPGTDLFGQAGQKWLASLELDDQDRWLIDSDLRILETIQVEIAKLDQNLSEKGYSDERVRLLMTLPGVNYVVALGLIATLGDINRFSSPDKAAAYIGLVPSMKQSSNKCYMGSITRHGNSQTRWLMVQAAQHAGRHPGPLGAFFSRIKRKKNHSVAVVAVARKLVTIAWHMLKHNEPYRYAIPRSTEEKLRKLRVKATGERRKSGPKKGSKTDSKADQKVDQKVDLKHSDNSQGSQAEANRARNVKPLSQIYEEEGVPALQPFSAGEERMLEENGMTEFVDTIRKPQTRTYNRKSDKRKTDQRKTDKQSTIKTGGTVKNKA